MGGTPQQKAAPKAGGDSSPVPKTTQSSPPLFKSGVKSPSKAAPSTPQNSEPETQNSPAPVPNAPVVPKPSEAPPNSVPSEEAKAPIVPPKSTSPPVEPSMPPKASSPPVEPSPPPS